MDLRLRQCIKLKNLPSSSSSIVADRLSSLPDEVLVQILSLVSTKDAVRVCVLSRRLRSVFLQITTLDFDDFPISYCVRNTYGVEMFPTFVKFVNNVLQACQCEYLTRFRLGVGPNFPTRYTRSCKAGNGGCNTECFPDLESTIIYEWISIPLSCCGLRELDLRIHVREQGYAQLPMEIFTCETLEVLKLDVNLGFDQVYSTPSFRLPKLKLLHLYASLISGDGLVTRLVSGCPLLEDLIVDAWCDQVRFTRISSPSLRRLSLRITKLDLSHNPDFVHIDTPNLEYLMYHENLALQYSITTMPRLVKADIGILYELMNEEDTSAASYQQMLCLIRSVSNAHQLILLGAFLEVLETDNVKYDLPVFPNLKYLELGYCCGSFWHNTLVAFLSHSPVLETLFFPYGISDDYEEANQHYQMQLEKEREFCKSTLTRIPQCCKFHLTKIKIARFFGLPKEVEWVRFLLRHALVLEELVICRFDDRYNLFHVVDKMVLESTLNSLPRASTTCSIEVQ